MNDLGMLILLGLLATVTAITEPIVQQKDVLSPTYKPLSYDQIVKIVEAPLYRGNPSAVAAAEPAALLAPVPSLVLEVPRADAVDSFNAKSLTDSTQLYQTFKPSPLLNIKPLPLTQPSSYYRPPSAQDQEALLAQYLPSNPHSKQLDLPLPVPSTELQIPPLQQQYQPYADFNPYVQTNPDVLYDGSRRTADPIKPLHVPTSQFPKKYNSNVHDHKPKKVAKVNSVEIIDDGNDERATASGRRTRPQKYSAAPVESSESARSLEKQRSKFDDAQKKIQSKKENDSWKQQSYVDATLARAKGEPVAAETGFASYEDDSAPQSEELSGIDDVAHGAGGGGGARTDFQMHGQHGPNSYKFGYDTGEGYEERDNDGYVKGHYGFYDNDGKLQIVNYDAHPHHGFHAEGSFGKA